jgi:hypothetical protein
LGLGFVRRACTGGGSKSGRGEPGNRLHCHAQIIFPLGNSNQRTGAAGGGIPKNLAHDCRTPPPYIRNVNP